MKSSGLDLATYDGFRSGGKRGPAFSPAAPADSVVLRYLTGELKPPMPMSAPPLAKADIDVIGEWSASGARDDSPRESLSNAPTVCHKSPVITAIRFSPDGKLLADRWLDERPAGVSRVDAELAREADGGGVTQAGREQSAFAESVPRGRRGAEYRRVV